MIPKLLLAFTFLSTTALAQQEPLTKGTITFEQTLQFRRNLVGLDPALAERIPQSRTQRFELLFTPEASLYRKAEEESADFAGGEGNVRFSMRTVGGSEGDLFRQLKTGVMVQERELGDDTYLVVDTVLRRTGSLASLPDSVRKRMSKLKLQPDSTKMIAGYLCQRATFTTQMRIMSSMQTQEMRKKMMEGASNGGGMRLTTGGPGAVQGDSSYQAETVLWFTKDIPVQAGPASFGNLPGMVLEASTDNGRVVYRAVEVSPTLREKEVKQPSSGKQVTQKEFQEKMMTFMEKMRQSGGGMRTMRF